MKKAFSFFLIFSLLWSHCIWARNPQPMCEEDVATASISNRFNVVRTFQDLTRQESLLALGTSIGTAGLTFGLCDKLGVSLNGMGFFIYYDAISGPIIGGQDKVQYGLMTYKEEAFQK